MIAGTLEVQLLANVARLQADMTQAKGAVGSAMREIQNAARLAMTALGALGATLTVGYFSGLVKSAIEAQARMKDLAQEAGTTASAISRFEQPARLAGLSTESVAAAIFKMSKAALEAKDPMSSAGQALKAIGISTAELKGLKPDEMFERVARQLDKYGDGIAKNNVMQELFGKSGREMARVVKEVAEQQQLHASVTDEEAEAADRLQDQIELARIESEKFWRSLATDGVPVFYAMVKAFNEGKKEAGLYEAAIRSLGAALSEGFLGLFGDPERKRVAELAKEIAELEKKIAEGGKDLGVGVKDRSMIGGYIQRVTQLKAELAGLQSFLETQKRAPAKTEETKPPLVFDPEAARKAAEELKRLRELDAKGWVAYVEAITAEYEEGLRADGKALDEWRANEAKALKLSDAEWVKYIDATIEEYERGLREVGSLQPSYMEAMQKQWGGFLDGIESAFRTGWDAFAGGAKNAAQVARDALKRTLYDWLWQAMAKPFVLNIVAGTANSLGLSGLGSAATAASGGMNLLGGLGSLFGGPELLSGAPSFLESLPGMISTAGPYVAAIAAAAALFQAFRDKGENWKGKLGFGSNANAYTTTGPFGVQGFEYIAGNDATNRAIQTFMGSTLGIDRQLAARMTPAQIAAITGRLTGAYSTRNDGQPAEFAFGKDDATAAQQLTMEFLQRKYGAIFDEVDGEFAKFIRGFTGTSEELLKAIGEFAGLLDMLDATGIKGLNITTLRAFQKEGEELGATFARITQQFAKFQDLFYTDAEKIGLAQEQVSQVFEDLGIAVPASNEAFRGLVESLDLSTESGRKMFEALMNVAPAFASVTSAAKSLLDTFDQIVGSMRPGYSRNVLEQNLEAEVGRFMGGASWTQGRDWRYVAGQLRNITREDFQNYSLAQQQIITTILSIMSQLDALDASAGNAAGSVGSLGTAARTAADAMANAKGSLWEYLQGLLVNPSLSPLPLGQQIAIARGQYDEQLRLAQGGDIGAASGLQGYISTLLNLARSGYGSGFGYREIFDYVMGTAGDFARENGGEQLQIQQLQTQVSILNVLLDIRDRGTAGDFAIADAVSQSRSAETYEPR